MSALDSHIHEPISQDTCASVTFGSLYQTTNLHHTQLDPLFANHNIVGVTRSGSSFSNRFLPEPPFKITGVYLPTAATVFTINYCLHRACDDGGTSRHWYSTSGAVRVILWQANRRMSKLKNRWTSGGDTRVNIRKKPSFNIRKHYSNGHYRHKILHDTYLWIFSSVSNALSRHGSVKPHLCFTLYPLT